MKYFSAFAFSALFCLAACSDKSATVANADETTKVVSAETSQSKPMELAWEDLMPEGEDAILADLYESYYEELERQMMQGSQDLSDMTAVDSAEFDLSTITEGSANDTMDQIGTFNVVSDLNGQKVRIPGYVVPLDFNPDSKYKEFLLVPYFGACLHTPPPPPNQIVLVKADPPALVDNIYDPVWLEGTLKTGEYNSDLADTAYELSLSKIENYYE